MHLEWRRRPLFFAALLFSVGIFSWHFLRLPEFIPSNDISRELHGKNRPVFLGGHIVTEVEERRAPFGGSSVSFVMKVGRLWDDLDAAGKTVQGRVRVNWKNPPARLEYGNVIVLEGELADFKEQRNPGGFDAKAFWDRQNVRAAFYPDKKARYKFLSQTEGNFLKAGAIHLKKMLSQRLSMDFKAQDAAFLKALFLGERSELDQDFKDLFLKTGTMHILAVSGFNIGFLSAILWLFLKPFPLSRNFKLVMTLGVIWGYCLLVGWHAPVVRASVMGSVIAGGALSGRKTDGLNALGLAALVVLGWNPKQFFDVGFELSFLAVFGLIALAPVFIVRPKRLPHERWTLTEKAVFSTQELFWVSFICYLLTLPIVVQNFYIVTPYSLLANLIVVPVSFLLFLCGAVYFLTFGWVPHALFFVPGVMKLFMAILVRGLYAIENLPGAVCVVGRLEPWLAVFLTLGIFYFFFEKRIQTRRGRALILVLFCLNIFLAEEVVREAGRKFEMTMLDVGQGDAIYFQFPKGGNLLVDAGGARFSDKGRWVVAPFLRSKGVSTLDAVAISHPQEDHVGGLVAVLDGFKVKNILESDRSYTSELWKNIRRQMAREGSKVWTTLRGDEVRGFPGVKIKVLHPEKNAVPDKNINNDCVVLKIDDGKHSILMTGDIEEPAMKDILNSGQDLKVDVLKVPHHGAKLKAGGAAFVQEVSPKISLISVGERNPFGHPTPETLAVLEAIPGNKVLRTDQNGAISILEGDNQVIVKKV